MLCGKGGTECCVVPCASLAVVSRRERQAVPLLDERSQSRR
nr:MAG TPA: hypothetical protein [Caudoviricetes sp.]